MNVLHRVSNELLEYREPNAAHLLGGHGLLASLGQLGDSPAILPQVDLASDKDNGQTRAKVEDLGNPLRAWQIAMNRVERGSVSSQRRKRVGARNRIG